MLSSDQEYFFICLGAAIFLAAGGTVVNEYHNLYTADRSAGLGLAACLLATGLTMAIDFGLMIFNC